MKQNNDLEHEIETIRNQEKRFGWLNSCLQYFVATLALVGSVGASLLAAFEAPKVLTAIVAAIPAAVAAVTKIFPFERRALAHWRKEYRLHGLLAKLRYEGVDPKSVSQEFREIESKTTYKVVSNPEHADSELIGKITMVMKTLINVNQVNEVRESQMIMNVEIIWRDLRPGQQGQLLSAARQGGTQAPAGPLDPTAPPPPPTLVTAMGNFVPELGGSSTSAQKDCVDRAAVQIISMMEIWPEPSAAPVVPAAPIAP